jgi:pimeloyl-ACP methyl ester carboxylesterase
MALQYAHENIDLVDRVWLLDVVPGQANDSVENVIGIVSRLQDVEFGSKKDLVHRLTAEEGLDTGTAQWLASSYVGPGNFGFDLEVVHDILPEFGSQDFDGMLRALLEANVKVDLIRGGKNKAWNVETLNRLEKWTKMFPDGFGLHVLPKAGHWVHVDDLKGLVNIITSSKK